MLRDAREGKIEEKRPKRWKRSMFMDMIKNGKADNYHSIKSRSLS